VVDEQRLRRLLRGIEDDVAFLEQFAGRDVELILRDDVVLRGIKYGFITAIEGCAKVAHHLAASEAWSVAETNADAVRILASKGVIGHELARDIASAVGFRNLLVHQYGDVDNRLVVGHLGQLRDLRQFVESVQHWVRQQ
jgi:uncharacterized protein YutE (UPF0331/DUF86 family)